MYHWVVLVVKNPRGNAGDVKDMGSVPGLGRSPEGGNGNPTPVSLPGESHRQRSLAGYSPRGHTESDTTQVTAHTHIVGKLTTRMLKKMLMLRN